METEFKVDLRHTSLAGLELSDNVKDEHYNFFIHFDFDRWEGDLLDDMRNQTLAYKGRFHQHRMLPQGVSYYFYSYEGKAFVNQNELQLEIDEALRKEIKLKV